MVFTEQTAIFLISVDQFAFEMQTRRWTSGTQVFFFVGRGGGGRYGGEQLYKSNYYCLDGLTAANAHSMDRIAGLDKTTNGLYCL